MENKKAIIWFRQDLRISDNPCLNFALEQNFEIIPIYILDNLTPKENKIGSAAKVWLSESLKKLNISLDKKLNIYSGEPLVILENIIKENQVDTVLWNRRYEPWRIDSDKTIKQKLKNNQINVKSFNGSLLWEPWDILKSDNTPYKVFTPYYKKGCFNTQEPRYPKTSKLDLSKIKKVQKEDFDDLIKKLYLVQDKKWQEDIYKFVDSGESNARDKLKEFIANGVKNYKKGRDMPSEKSVSRLSAHLHFGEISPNQVWHAICELNQDTNTEHFLSEIGWREFSYYLLYHFPSLPEENLRKKFDNFPWQNKQDNLIAWQKGETGYPIIDAGMRQLYKTGYMHNRIRMVCASFLTKNLLTHWKSGMQWFWDCLFDADLASNSAGWQWVAGSGADAAPYFRIFNPKTQGEKFDPEGIYVKEFVPELKNMPKQYIHKPWEAPENILKEANINLGKDYPKPIIDLKLSREHALLSYEKIKGAQSE